MDDKIKVKAKRHFIKNNKRISNTKISLKMIIDMKLLFTEIY